MDAKGHRRLGDVGQAWGRAGLILHGGNEGDCLNAPWSCVTLLHLKCSSTNLHFLNSVPFTTEKMLGVIALSKTKHTGLAWTHCIHSY